MSLFRNRQLSSLQDVIRHTSRGIYKRIDENRQLLAYLHESAPTLMRDCPWIEGWIESHDRFFVRLAGVAGIKNELDPVNPVNHPDCRFPRPWPTSQNDGTGGRDPGSMAPDHALLRALVALARRKLCEANASRASSDSFPAGRAWRELNDTERQEFLQAACIESGIPFATVQASLPAEHVASDAWNGQEFAATPEEIVVLDLLQRIARLSPKRRQALNELVQAVESSA